VAARTVDELRAHLLAVGPSVRGDPGELVDVVDTIIAEIFADVEAAIYTLHARRYIETADGSWLEEHGSERNISRFRDESDASYSTRIRAVLDQVTKPAILEQVDAILVVGTSRMEEWLTDSMYVDIQDRRGFSGMTSTHGQPRGFTLFISEQLAARSSRGFALDVPADPFKAAGTGVNHTFAGDGPGDDTTQAAQTMFADGENPPGGDIYAQIYRLTDRIRAGGLGPPPHFIVEFE
jgi:hypothetical protein